MDNNNNWEKICDQVQHRICEAIPLKVNSAKHLRGEILKCLIQAHDHKEKILLTKPDEIRKLLKLVKSQETGQNKIFEIIGGGSKGGEKNFKRRKEIPHFERFDQCWFDFFILIDENPKPAEVIGFNFEIRFPENYDPAKFLRFDLNSPNHNNEERGMRFHVHPSSDDFMIHSPPMTPLEILHLFLYGLPIPDKRRSS
ncbi:hypothetical protein L2E69_01065 [Planktothrix agardhii 1806]|uniref:hypothetical protein n=1 Tax=Planktothrix agardhii TaxID=1160 RepID=UPI001F21A4CE|nr:hypothetical protein [Planktothrix agardhii]MCF3573492.1 hypothetical protein [Planktothrix agardhii 1805]MCF3583997.1 hypothetical protein [Planktothrix agardhii 1803]MCF3604656.1 hypothetical protein [Planktothrix agardhii 1804]MCF3614538.1 hypothetical protein [Planktothrix agardhii 1806]MCP9293991.1 hypothetical protein [Planktothrix agardhii LY1]